MAVVFACLFIAIQVKMLGTLYESSLPFCSIPYVEADHRNLRQRVLLEQPLKEPCRSASKQ